MTIVGLDRLSRKLSGGLDRLDNSGLDRLSRKLSGGLDRLDRFYICNLINHNDKAY